MNSLGDLDVNGIDSVDKNFISLLTNGHTKRFFPLYASSTSRRIASKSFLGHADAQLTSPCLFTDCSFDDVTMCYYVSDNQLKDDEDLLLDLLSVSNLKKWKISNRKVANSLTGIMRDVSGDGWFAYAGETNNPAAIFLMRMSKAIMIPEESLISFYIHMAGKYGRLRVCLDSLQKCPFERNGRELSVKTRGWTNFYINVSSGLHTVKPFFFFKGLMKRNEISPFKRKTQWRKANYPVEIPPSNTKSLNI
uniref:Homing endonuclease LAGLIDADG domain-containing protein n=1 Tax=Setaria digitata TaxID=48799 RepID=A0A915PQA1_9BILA